MMMCLAKNEDLMWWLGGGARLDEIEQHLRVGETINYKKKKKNTIRICWAQL